MIFIDTSHLIALAVPKDGLHAVAEAWSRRLAGPFVTTDHVLVEFFNRMSIPILRGMAHPFLNALLAAGVEVRHITSEQFHHAVAFHQARYDKAWSLTDCISFQVMWDAGITQALTHDHHFEQAGFKALFRDMP